MTSKSAKSIIALSRDAQKVPITINGGINDVTLELKEKRILQSKLRKLSIGGSTNPLVFWYARLIKADMSKLGIAFLRVWEMAIVRYTLFSCNVGIPGTEILTLQYIDVVFHVPFPTEYEQSDDAMVVLPPLTDKQ
uniref:Uncharacterized protein n=1 Tax=Lactuca sativa TaxID=4236 RepID=A0A9R1WCT6_LACSA|nr:hypothetical protein LSAT_V11C200087700 [Lactuca sativa]